MPTPVLAIVRPTPNVKVSASVVVRSVICVVDLLVAIVVTQLLVIVVAALIIGALLVASEPVVAGEVHFTGLRLEFPGMPDEDSEVSCAEDSLSIVAEVVLVVMEDSINKDVLDNGPLEASNVVGVDNVDSLSVGLVDKDKVSEGSGPDLDGFGNVAVHLSVLPTEGLGGSDDGAVFPEVRLVGNADVLVRFLVGALANNGDDKGTDTSWDATGNTLPDVGKLAETLFSNDDANPDDASPDAKMLSVKDTLACESRDADVDSTAVLDSSQLVRGVVNVDNIDEDAMLELELPLVVLILARGSDWSMLDVIPTVVLFAAMLGLDRLEAEMSDADPAEGVGFGTKALVEPSCDLWLLIKTTLPEATEMLDTSTLWEDDAEESSDLE